MAAPTQRLRLTLSVLLVISLVPVTVAAQAPVYLTQWGSAGNGAGQFDHPSGVATDAAGDVYVVDSYNYRVQKFSSAGAYLTQWGSLGSDNGQFEGPLGIGADAAGNVYVLDQINGVQKFTGTGAFLARWGSLGNGDGQFFFPNGMTAGIAGDVYVADSYNQRIQRFTNTGVYLTQWGSFGHGDGEFDVPTGVAVDGFGNVYVADMFNNRIQKFTGTGAYIAQWGASGSDTSADGRLNRPGGVATDVAGNVYVADTRNQRIQKFTGAGAYLAKWGSFGSGDGAFDTPFALAVDADDNVYVVDVGNYRIQKFGPAPRPVAMAFDLTPGVLNLVSNGLRVSGFLEPPAPYTPGDIDVASIRLNGTVPVDPAAPTAVGDHDGNGVPDLMVKFDRAAVELTVSDGDAVPVTVAGSIGTESFLGTDLVRVRRAVISAPAAGSHLTAGSVTRVQWQTPGGVAVESVALLQSLDGGGTWNTAVLGQPDVGGCDWTVPAIGTDRARVAVVLVESADPTGTVVTGVLGVSDAFTIDAPAGADLGAARLALRPLVNPSRDELRVSFSLRDSGPATLVLFDLNGRQLEARRLEGMGAGWHSVTFGASGDLPAGLYFIRLSQGGRSLTARGAFVR